MEAVNRAKPVVVIKFGGSLYEEKVRENQPSPFKALSLIIQKLIGQGVGVILVHGGGKSIDRRLKQLKLESQFHKGYRKTGDAEINEIEMLLTGHVRHNLVHSLNQLNIQAVGISGKDCGLIEAKKKEHLFDGTKVDLGWVGEIVDLKTDLIQVLVSVNMVPVISPIGWDNKGNTYNINADTVAGKVAEAVVAQKLLLMTDVEGLYHCPTTKQGLITKITCSQLAEWINSGQLDGGMIPKGLAAIGAMQQGVQEAVICNGNDLESLNMILKNENGFIGTSVVLDER